MPYEVVVMRDRYAQFVSGAWVSTKLEVNGIPAKVTTPGHKGIEYHNERVEQAIDKLSQPEVK